jgi:hypothetical protein
LRMLALCSWARFATLRLRVQGFCTSAAALASSISSQKEQATIDKEVSVWLSSLIKIVTLTAIRCERSGRSLFQKLCSEDTHLRRVRPHSGEGNSKTAKRFHAIQGGLRADSRGKWAVEHLISARRAGKRQYEVLVRWAGEHPDYTPTPGRIRLERSETKI